MPTTTTTTPQTGYAPVNGLQMYYEIHGSGGDVPLVLIHGAFSAIGTSFGALLPGLAAGRQTIGIDLQAHGRTADIDHPLRLEQLADDVVAFLKYLNIDQADLFGYSNGAAVAMRVATRNPEVVRKLVLASAAYSKDGVHPGLWEGLGEMNPEMLHGSVWHDEYLRIAPRPEDFPTLFAKKTEMDQAAQDIPAETFAAIAAPVLLIIGDSDLVPPEHAVEMFRLLGGGVFGDMAGMPKSQLAILPGAMHSTLTQNVDMLLTMIPRFLDAPLPEPN